MVELERVQQLLAMASPKEIEEITPEKHLILQPMTSAEELRAYLCREGFGVFREETAREDNRLYTVMLVWYDPDTASRNAANPAFLYRGLVDGSTPDGRNYLLARASSLRKRVGGLRCMGQEREASDLETICCRLEQEADERSAGE